MQIKGISLSEFYDLTENVSRESYGGNIIVNPDAYAAPKHVTARIRAVSSSGLGARRAASGRRSVAACWHAYRDVLARIFDWQPDANVKTIMAAYNGREGFLRDYPGTACHNIGSLLRPTTMPALCGCDSNCPALATAANEPVDIVSQIDEVLSEFDTIPQIGLRNGFNWTPTDEPYPF